MDEEFAGNRVGVLGLEPHEEAFLPNTLSTMEIRRWSLPTARRLIPGEHPSIQAPSSPSVIVAALQRIVV